jgi:hypothetical protein
MNVFLYDIYLYNCKFKNINSVEFCYKLDYNTNDDEEYIIFNFTQDFI